MFLKCFHSVIASYSCLLSMDRFCDTKRIPHRFGENKLLSHTNLVTHFPQDCWELFLTSITKPIDKEYVNMDLH